jgi:RHS repeat-associated protein
LKDWIPTALTIGNGNNNLLWRKIQFASITTARIRVTVSAASDGVARIAEVEAWTASSGSSAQLHWLVTDQLGTPRMILDQSGSLANVSRHDYLPFGEEIGANVGGRTTTQGYTLSDDLRQKFTGKERDNETGLDFFGARYYATVQGRFTTTDPTYFQFVMLVDPQRLNLYGYARNNPLKWVDPEGEQLYLRGNEDWLTTNVLHKMAGGQEEFDKYFDISDGQVVVRDGVDISNANEGIQELAGLATATENYVYFAGTDGGAVADLFKDTRNGNGKLNENGKRVSNFFTCGGDLKGGCGIQSGTTGRPMTDQPADLANGDTVFAVIAYNTNAVQKEVNPDFGKLSPVSDDVQMAQEAGKGQEVRPVSYFIHESTENQKFAAQGAGRMNYDEAHAYAIVREATIRKALNIGGGFAGANLNTTVRK